MILTCDVCGRKYENSFDCHDVGEPNTCCLSCVWELSHLSREPKPKHTCKEVKKWKVS